MYYNVKLLAQVKILCYTMHMRFNWNENEHLLGQMTDHALALRIGCTKAAVHYQRKRRGIVAFARTQPPGKAVKITLPEGVVSRIDSLASDLKRTRSDVAAELLVAALN